MHRVRRSAWWFSSDGSGRFDLPVPHGTCYLAEEPLAALLEVTRGLTILSEDFLADRRLLTATLTVEMRVADNADLASGHANVVVLSPLGGWSQTPLEQDADPADQFEGLRRPPEWGTDLAHQVEGLRKQGSHVEMITPDAESRATMGTNQMDLATRIPAARAGFAEGR